MNKQLTTCSGIVDHYTIDYSCLYGAEMGVKNLLRTLVAGFDGALSPLSPVLGTRDLVRGCPPVFVVGGPRSGSTLFSQVVLGCRRFAYLNNVVARFPRSAPVIAKLLRVASWPGPTSFESEYGDTKGLCEPSEAGDLWDWVFPWSTHHDLNASELSPESEFRLQLIARSLSSIYQAPFLSKNLWNSVRLEAIDRALPDALYVVIVRDPLFMAQSILRGRRRALGNGPGLWSIRPRELLDFIDAPPIDQVAMQLVFTYRAIEKARMHLGRARFLYVSYERFCRKPERGVALLDEFMAEHGVELSLRGQLNRTFNPTQTLELSPQERTRFETIFFGELPDFPKPGAE